MHKRVYTVTLDIECWDDLKLDSIDWAKRVGLFPDEFIHSSVQEHSLPRLVDRTCYRRLQILFQSSVSDEGFLSVLPQTLVLVINTL